MTVDWITLQKTAHDEFARRYVGHEFGGIEVAEDAMHRTADGRMLWITHGDLFDGVIQCARWLAHVGDWAYETTLRINRHLNSLRARVGLPYWSFSLTATDANRWAIRLVRALTDRPKILFNSHCYHGTVDESLIVLDGAGRPIPGLYAAGNDLASIMGGNYPGGGITLGPAMTFGYIAAHHMAHG